MANQPNSDEPKEEKATAASPAGAPIHDDTVGQIPDEGSVPQPDTAPPPDKMNVVGSVLWLMTHSPAHRHLFVTDLEWLLLPPIALGQFYLWRRSNYPVGVATWALLSDEVEKRLTNGVRRLAPAEWKSGENLWLMDFIVPFGGKDAALKELREKVFKDKNAKTLRPASKGEGVRVVEL